MGGGNTTASAHTALPSDYPPGYLQEDRSGILTNTIIGLFVATTLAVFLRTASRRVQWSGWMWGDIFIPISYLCMIGLFVCSILCVQNGAGKHIVTVPSDQLIRFLILTHYPLPLIYIFAAFVPKLAILEIYIRFFLLDRIPRYITYGVAAIMIANAIVNIPFVAGQCEPVAYLWDKSIPGGYCNHAQEHFLWGSVANVVTDLIMMFLPMPLVLKLQSSKKVKWGIFTTFAVGSIGLIFSILRFFGFDVQYTDGTFIAPTVIISALVETSVYLICACFFTYRPLFRRIAQMTAFAPFFTRITSRRTKSSQLSESSAHTGMDPRASGSGPWTRLEPIVGGNKARSGFGHDHQRPDSGEIGVAVPMVSMEAGASRVADRKSKSGLVTVRPKDGDEEEGLSFEDMMKLGSRR